MKWKCTKKKEDNQRERDGVVVDGLDLTRVIVEGADWVGGDLGLPQSAWPSLQAQQQKNQVPNHNGSSGYYDFFLYAAWWCDHFQRNKWNLHLSVLWSSRFVWV